MPDQSLPPAAAPPSASTPLVVTVKPRGTIIIPAPLIVQDPEGNVLPQPSFKQPGVVKFCGCGRSGNKPFCDGSHKTISDAG